MNSELNVTFLSRYLRSLREETRQEKTGKKYGFDHIVLKLAEADNLVPLRMAYFREGPEELPKPKKEPEHGVDLKVISRDGKVLTVFVLKGVKLTYKNWTAHKFDEDLRRASAQDLRAEELSLVETVKIILVYNQDDDAAGIEAYNKLVGGLPDHLKGGVSVQYERWNLTILTEKVLEKLISSPALVPENFFKPFSYICWQVGDFTHGSEHWQTVLIPDWKEFLKSLLSERAGEREVGLVSVVLIILRSHGRDHPSWETGWIEMVEWAVLEVWNAASRFDDEKGRGAAFELWITFYINSLEDYYDKNGHLLAVEDSLSIGGGNEFAEIVGSFQAFWHLGRLGILALGFEEVLRSMDGDPEQSDWVEKVRGALIKTIDWIIGMLNANVAGKRPMLDCHHIQLFLLWRVLWYACREDEFLAVAAHLHELLVIRRFGLGGVRLIDQSNSWESVLEFVATETAPSEAFGKSSYLLQMLIEILVGTSAEGGKQLAHAFHLHLIEGKGDDGETLKFPERVEPMSWIPSEDFVRRMFEGTAPSSGECVSISYHFDNQAADPVEAFAEEVRRFVSETRSVSPKIEAERVPLGVFMLACLRHDSPVPPEMWRMACFPREKPEGDGDADPAA
jgi:hypothetical protein